MLLKELIFLTPFSFCFKVQNRSQRLVFDVSSPNGYLLFRETSKLICCYGNRILSIDVPKDQIYQMKFKGISVCFLMLKAILSGNYVNLGVFKLYGDETFDNVMNTTAKLILSIPHADLMVIIIYLVYFIYFICFIFVGVSKTVYSILYSVGMLSSGSYKISFNFRTDCIFVYIREYI